MNAQWKLLECFKVIKTQPSTSLFMSLAIFAVIATVANVAKIAYEDRSLVVNFFLFVTIIQVWDLHKSWHLDTFIFSLGETSTWLGSTFQVPFFSKSTISKMSSHFKFILLYKEKSKKPCSMQALLSA